MNCKGIIFDLFHTLTGLETESPALPPTCEVLGVERRTWNRALTESSRWRLVGEERDATKIIRRLAHAIDEAIPEEAIQDATRVRTERFRRALRNVPEENIETLRSLRSHGFRLGLISNTDAVEVAAWPDTPLSGMFDTVVFSCDVGHVKPEPEIYIQCLETLGQDAKDCLFVGDGGSNELQGARNLGMEPVFVSGVIAELWPDVVPGRRAQVRYEIEAVPELLALLGLTGGSPLPG